MGDHYRRRLKSLIYEYNRIFAGPYYFSQFFTHKHIKEAKVADLGSGPVCTLGTLWGSIDIQIRASDILAPAYLKALKEIGCTLLTPLEYQDMESLTYKDNTFDLVHCVNALDHTRNVKKALTEMKRVCKPNGYIYLRHTRSQKRAHHGNGHYWDARIDGFFGDNEIVTLSDFVTTDDGHNIVSIYQKPSI